jgi:hypothetical protein
MVYREGSSCRRAMLAICVTRPSIEASLVKPMAISRHTDANRARQRALVAAALLALWALGACADGSDRVLIQPGAAPSAESIATDRTPAQPERETNPWPEVAVRLAAPVPLGSPGVQSDEGAERAAAGEGLSDTTRGTGGDGGVRGIIEPDAGTGRASAGNADDVRTSRCGVALDSDPAPRVRFINALATPANPAAYPPMWLRPLANGVPLLKQAIPPQSDSASVSEYVRLEPGDVTFGYELEPSATDSEDGARRLREALPVHVGPYERYTVLAVGDDIVETFEAKQIVVIQEQRQETPCDRARLQFVWADSSAAPGITATIPSFFVPGNTSPAAVASFGAASPIGTVEVPVDMPSLTITIPAGVYLGRTEQAPFSLPPGALIGGRSYLVLTTGTLQAIMPQRSYRLTLVSADGGEASSRTIYRDPMVTFVHASPPPTPAKLEVHSELSRVAINLEYPPTAAGLAGGITVADLPPGEARLSFLDATDAGRGTRVLADQATGDLSPGAFYLMLLEGLSEATGAAARPLQTRLYRIDPLEQALLNQKPATQVVFFHASPTAPTLDLGYIADGRDLAESFVAVHSSIEYGTSTELGAIDFPAPRVILGGLSVNVGALRESGTALTRGWSAGTVTTFRLLVLGGDWQAVDGAAASRLIEIASFPWRTSVSPRGGKPWLLP